MAKKKNGNDGGKQRRPAVAPLSASKAKCIFMFGVRSFGRVTSINRMAHGSVWHHR